MSTSLDGYTEDEHGRFGWSAPTDEEAHTHIRELVSSFRTCLYGRRVYETMLYWETADQVRDQPRFLLEFARQWQAAEKIVYAKTLAEPRSARTRIEREFDPQAVRRLKAEAEHDLEVAGPELAAQAIRAGHVEIGVTRVDPHMIRPCAFAQHRPECMVRKLRKYPFIAPIGSVRISAKAVREHPRANWISGV